MNETQALIDMLPYPFPATEEKELKELYEKLAACGITDEPNVEVWVTPDGIYTAIIRHYRLGHLCGYVGVPVNHPLYGKSCDDLGISVHGGITYTAKGETNDLWWFGFDCAHSGDLTPDIDQQYRFPDSIYRDFAYVKKETESLKEQLMRLAQPTPQISTITSMPLRIQLDGNKWVYVTRIPGPPEFVHLSFHCESLSFGIGFPSDALSALCEALKP